MTPLTSLGVISMLDTARVIISCISLTFQLSRLRDSVTLGLETVGIVYSALHHYNAGPAERVERV